eukprot:972653-Prorocentrum_minimum.AAC.1
MITRVKKATSRTKPNMRAAELRNRQTSAIQCTELYILFPRILQSSPSVPLTGSPTGQAALGGCDVGGHGRRGGKQGSQ